MRGRILSIKKTTILKLSFVINILLFLVSSVLSFVLVKNYDLWFFAFCIFIGLHLIIKSCLFKFDSSCYFGTMLLTVGLFYVYCSMLSIINFYPVFITLSMSLASFFTAFFYKQNFHYYISFALYLLSIFLLFFMINYISLWIFLAILACLVLLLVGRYLLIN